MSKYTPIIGLEVHVELKTKSKMFCRCSADYFGAEPNTHTCPVCLGLPGALPVPNKQAIDWCVMIALALNCEINEFSKFDRKNYFYPDLPKGYQISQYDLPFGKDGSMKLKSGKTIRIRRVHMEEDTGKLIHQDVDNVKTSLIDFNRSSVPLVEIVTEPDFNNAEDVIEYLQRLQQIVRYLEVSNADMEKGDMRLEPNISLTTDINVLPNYKVEVKNINSFRFVGKSIEFEIKRQTEILGRDETPVQETRGWNESQNGTVSQRVKEEANDYRYFPEPDIPPIRHSKDEISNLRERVPELPEAKISRFVRLFGIPNYDAEILCREKSLADYFEAAVELGKEKNISAKQIANAIINKKIDHSSISAEKLIRDIAESSKVESIDETELQTIIDKVISENEKAVSDYKSGKESVIMFLVGQCMRVIGRRVDVQQVKSQLIESIK
jgi:aspartyl-tRNA(Asn)/glutamyl-tRNA(Gln) amidotransferase subunit B